MAEVLVLNGGGGVSPDACGVYVCGVHGCFIHGCVGHVDVDICGCFDACITHGCYIPCPDCGLECDPVN